MKQEPRLQFSDEDHSNPRLKQPVRRAEKAAATADKAQAKLPKKTVLKKSHSFDPATGRVKTNLRFEEVTQKRPSKLAHSLRQSPGNVISSQVHREVQESEQDNVGVEAAHHLEGVAESGGRLITSAHYAHKLKPYRASAAAEHRMEKANLDVLYKKAQMEAPISNPLSKWQQKQAIKKQYAAAKRSGKTAEATKKTTEGTAKAAKKAAEKTQEAVQFVWRHRRGFAIAMGLFLILAFFLNGLSSCSVLIEGAGSGIAASTYPNRDEDMLGAEAQYAEMEAELQEMLDSYEDTHDYDEYIFELDEIKHDPYVLISILTAYHQGEWALDEVQGTLQMLFERQYILTEEVETETRYETEIRTGWRYATDPRTGEILYDNYGYPIWEEYEYEVEVPYDYYICTVTLENFNLSHLPIYIMGQEQMEMYAVYMATLGNRPDLFPGSEYVGRYGEGSYTDYDIPQEALEDEVFAAMIAEAEKYLGYPYVWGGSNPSTSFDCSGFVSWVINHSGWDVGRLGAQGLYNICTRTGNPQPGDLVFFEGTYDTDGVSHVGIYVGNSTMIHCGDPISYTNLNSSYWQAHLYAYGRLP